MDTEVLFNGLLADAEKMLQNSTPTALLMTGHSIVNDTPEDIRKRSDADIMVITVLASLAMVYIAKRKEEAERMNENH